MVYYTLKTMSFFLNIRVVLLKKLVNNWLNARCYKNNRHYYKLLLPNANNASKIHNINYQLIIK